jgi:hypothetical protein
MPRTESECAGSAECRAQLPVGRLGSQSMIPKSVQRFSEKIMLKQESALKSAPFGSRRGAAALPA